MRSWLICVVILAAFVPLASAEEYSFNLTAQERVHSAEPGETVPILLDMTNTGEGDSYRIEIVAIGLKLGDWDDPDPNLWKAEMVSGPGTFSLYANESTTITINVSVPVNAKQGDSAVIGGAVFSVGGDLGLSAQAVTTITVITLNTPSLGLLVAAVTTIVSGKVFCRRG